MIHALVPLILVVCAGQRPSLSYELVVLDPADERALVRATLSDLDPAVEVIDWRMAERYAFVALEAPRLVAPPRATGAAGEVLELRGLGARHWRLTTGAAREVQLEWSVRLDHRTQPGVVGRDEYEFPYLAADHGMLQTAALLLVPELEVASRSIELELPEGWPSFGPWPRDAAGAFLPAGERSLASNLFAVGRWSAHEVERAGARVSLLYAPGQERLEELSLPVIGPLIEAELELFEHRAFESYLILFGRPEGRGPRAAAWGARPSRAR